MRKLLAAAGVALALGSGPLQARDSAEPLAAEPQLAFVSDRHWNVREVWLTTADSDRQRQVLPRFQKENRAVVDPAWSPDHRRLAVSFDDRSGSYDVGIVDAGGRLIRHLTRLRGDEREAAWSPDGRQIVFTYRALRADRTWSSRGLYTVDAAGGRLHRLAAAGGCARHPAWSPDGRAIAFQRGCYASQGIYVVGADGRGLRRLVAAPAQEPDWSPDGRTLLYVAASRARVLDVATGQSRQLALRSAAADAVFSPDGRWIAYVTVLQENCLGEPNQPNAYVEIAPLAGGAEREVGGCGDGGSGDPDW